MDLISLQVILLLIFADVFRKSTHASHTLGGKLIGPLLTLVKIIATPKNNMFSLQKAGFE